MLLFCFPSKISIETNSPLLLYAENQGNRSVFLLGENIWKWRLQSHIDMSLLLNLMSLWTKQFST
jgi:hypothetical protein